MLLPLLLTQRLLRRMLYLRLESTLYMLAHRLRCRSTLQYRKEIPPLGLSSFRVEDVFLVHHLVFGILLLGRSRQIHRRCRHLSCSREDLARYALLR